MITLYSTGCPRCRVLKTKLDAAGIQYNTVTDVNEMEAKGINEVPVLMVDDNEMNFQEAIAYVNQYTGGEKE